MKRLFIVVIISIASLLLAQAQAPQGISYQAISFDATGNAVANSTVGVRISILQGSATGTAVYVETHTPTTNTQGLFNLNIGQGSATTGSFAGISWSTGNKYIKVEVDPAGGTNYTTVGTNQLMSVPYALFAETANTAINGGSGTANSNGNFLVYADDDASAWSSQTSVWTTVTMQAGFIDSIAESAGNFLVYADDDAAAWNEQTGVWTTTTMQAGFIDGKIGSQGNFLVYADDDAKAWNNQTSQWTAITMQAGFIDGIAASQGNFLVYADDDAAAWSGVTGQWTTVTMQAGFIDGLTFGGGNFLVYADDEAKAWNAQTGQWTTVTMQAGFIDGVLGSEEE